MGKTTTRLILGFLIFLLILNISGIPAQASAQNNENKICAVYITGVGCPHCAQTDPVILGNLLRKEPNLVVIEYEIYRQRQENGDVILQYDTSYASGTGIPLIIFNKDEYKAGDWPILENVDQIIKKGSNECPLADGTSVDFADLDIASLPGRPKIWEGERILISTGGRGDNAVLRNLLTSKELSAVLENVEFEIIKPQTVTFSGKNVFFENAVKIDGWIFQWNEEEITGSNITGNSVQKGALYKVKITTIVLALFIIVIMICLKIKESNKEKVSY